ncbi:unnamed protein product [Spirodela intermedia]|uniref:Uncharacterized protein n=1 Tax=Spirodela intermedia TaxID=51605 RepID=A0A7I8L529_SPIIN|nr:unnamed protein product [Spirodela intermedia]
MGRRIISGGCHSAERKNGDFAALRWLSLDGKELNRGREVATRLSMDRPLPDDGFDFGCLILHGDLLFIMS